jgi:GT2 family glycosyltransferase
MIHDLFTPVAERDPNIKRVAVILVNYQAPLDTMACVQSLYASDYPHWKIFIVENGSHDDSLQVLRQQLQPLLDRDADLHLPIRTHLIPSAKNLGFAGGCNLALAQADQEQFDYFWLLNNDTEVSPDALKELLIAAELKLGKALVGSALYFPQGQLQTAGRNLNLWTSRSKAVHQPVNDQQVDCLSGASLMVSRELYRTLGPLAEQFFLYCEDDEYCWRAKKQGIAAHLVTTAKVYHHLSRSTGQNMARQSYYLFRNPLLLWDLHASPLQCLTVKVYSLLRLIGAGWRAFYSNLPLHNKLKKPFTNALRHQQRFAGYWAAWHDYHNGVTGPALKLKL